jgi:hypothetical protein
LTFLSRPYSFAEPNVENLICDGETFPTNKKSNILIDKTADALSEYLTYASDVLCGDCFELAADPPALDIFPTENPNNRKQPISSDKKYIKSKTTLKFANKKEKMGCKNKFHWLGEKSIIGSAVIDCSDWIEIQRIKLHHGMYYVLQVMTKKT